MRYLERFMGKLLYKRTHFSVFKYLYKQGYAIERGMGVNESGKDGFFQYKVSRNGVTRFFKSDFQEEMFGFLMAVALEENNM